MNQLFSPLMGAALASVMMSAHADFIDDSHADVTLLNRYLNQQGRDISGSSAKAHSIRDWGQGFQFDFKSGYTAGTIGLGLDLQAFYGLKLDSGGDLNDKNHQGRYPGSMFPLDDGQSADQFGVLSPTFKARLPSRRVSSRTNCASAPCTRTTRCWPTPTAACTTRPTPARNWCPRTWTTSPSPSVTSTRPRSATKPATQIGRASLEP